MELIVTKVQGGVDRLKRLEIDIDLTITRIVIPPLSNLVLPSSPCPLR